MSKAKNVVSKESLENNVELALEQRLSNMLDDQYRYKSADIQEFFTHFVKQITDRDVILKPVTNGISQLATNFNIMQELEASLPREVILPIYTESHKWLAINIKILSKDRIDCNYIGPVSEETKISNYLKTNIFNNMESVSVKFENSSPSFDLNDNSVNGVMFVESMSKYLKNITTAIFKKDSPLELRKKHFELLCDINKIDPDNFLYEKNSINANNLSYSDDKVLFLLKSDIRNIRLNNGLNENSHTLSNFDFNNGNSVFEFSNETVDLISDHLDKCTKDKAINYVLPINIANDHYIGLAIRYENERLTIKMMNPDFSLTREIAESLRNFFQNKSYNVDLVHESPLVNQEFNIDSFIYNLANLATHNKPTKVPAANELKLSHTNMLEAEEKRIIKEQEKAMKVREANEKAERLRIEKLKTEEAKRAEKSRKAAERERQEGEKDEVASKSEYEEEMEVEEHPATTSTKWDEDYIPLGSVYRTEQSQSPRQKLRNIIWNNYLYKQEDILRISNELIKNNINHDSYVKLLSPLKIHDVMANDESSATNCKKMIENIISQSGKIQQDIVKFILPIDEIDHWCGVVISFNKKTKSFESVQYVESGNSIEAAKNNTKKILIPMLTEIQKNSNEIKFGQYDQVISHTDRHSGSVYLIENLINIATGTPVTTQTTSEELRIKHQMFLANSYGISQKELNNLNHPTIPTKENKIPFEQREVLDEIILNSMKLHCTLILGETEKKNLIRNFKKEFPNAIESDLEKNINKYQEHLENSINDPYPKKIYSGIGATGEFLNGCCKITEIFSNCPSNKIGLKAGDIITAVKVGDNWVKLEGISAIESQKLIRGNPGEKLALQIVRGNQTGPIGDDLENPILREFIDPIAQSRFDPAKKAVVAEFYNREKDNINKVIDSYINSSWSKITSTLGSLSNSLFKTSFDTNNDKEEVKLMYKKAAKKSLASCNSQEEMMAMINQANIPNLNKIKKRIMDNDSIKIDEEQIKEEPAEKLNPENFKTSSTMPANAGYKQRAK